MFLPKDRTQPNRRGSLCRRRGPASLVAIASLLPLIALAQSSRPASSRPAPSSQALIKEYQDRRDRLGANDVAGHYALAEWCRDHKLYQQLWREAAYVLRLEPGSPGPPMAVPPAARKPSSSRPPRFRSSSGPSFSMPPHSPNRSPERRQLVRGSKHQAGLGRAA